MILQAILDHWELFVQVAIFIGGGITIWAKLNTKVDLMASSHMLKCEEAKRERAAMMDRLNKIEEEIEHIDDLKVPRTEFNAVIQLQTGILDALRAEIRELNKHVVDLATAIRTNGGGHR